MTTSVDPAAGGRSLYNETFYSDIGPLARTAASVVAPLLVELSSPSSVVDIGCGTGAWLAEFASNGVVDYLGLDGDYVRADDLEIPVERFLEVDLEHPPTIDRRFDLAVSLEVGEHLAPNAAADFVAFLTSLAPVVAFSAATPGQGGVGHINEQWPAYWTALFRDRGFAPFDIVRPRIWTAPEVAGFYAQNLILYAIDKRFAQVRPMLPLVVDDDGLESPMSLVHPGVFGEVMAWRDRPRPPASFQSLVRALPSAGRSALARRIEAKRHG